MLHGGLVPRPLAACDKREPGYQAIASGWVTPRLCACAGTWAGKNYRTHYHVAIGGIIMQAALKIIISPVG